MTDKEIYLAANKAAGLVNGERDMEQHGIYKGAMIGAILERDKISVYIAKKKARVIGETYGPTWPKSLDKLPDYISSITLLDEIAGSWYAYKD